MKTAFETFRSPERTSMEPIDSTTAWKELISILLTRQQSPVAESVVTVLAQVLSQTVPIVEVKQVPSPHETGPPPLISYEKDIKPTQEDLIRGSFVLAGLDNSDACRKLIEAIKLRGSPLGHPTRMDADDFSTVLEFLHPELTFAARAKVATILSVVL